MFGPARRRIQEFSWITLDTESATDRLTITHVALAVACVLALFVFTQTVVTAIALRTDLPYADQWASVMDYGRLRSGDFGFEDWFAQHNEHRPAFPRLAMFGDFYLFGGQNYLLMTMNASLQFIETVLLAGAAFLLFRRRAGGAGVFVVCAAAALALQFTSAQIETFILPFQVQWTIGYTAGTGALAALVAASQQTSRSRRSGLLALAVALAVVAHYSVANGLWVWALMLGLTYWCRMPRTWFVIVAVAALASCAFYFLDYSRPPDSDNPIESMERPDRLIDFALVVVGSPALPPFDLWGARVLGAVGVVAMAALLVDAARRRQAYTGLPAFLLAQAIFSSLTIALIAAGRSPLGIEAAEAPRYCMPAASLWTALVVLAWHAAPGFRMPSVVERFGLAMAAVLIVLATVSPWQAVPPWEPVFNDLDQTEDAIRVGVYDDSAIVRIYPAPDDIKPFIPILDEYDISIFYRDELAKLIGTPLAETFGTAQGLCSGSFDATLDARSPAGAAVSGWAWDPNRTQRPPTVLIVGPDGVIRGLATAATDRVDVIASVPGVTTVATGWFGYSRPTEGPARAYAVVADGVVCPLNGEHEVVASFS